MATKKTKKVYEVSFHLIPTIADNAGKKFQEIKGVISGSGEILSEEAPEYIALAYTIRHAVRKQDGSYSRYNEAFFGSIKFRAGNEFAEELRGVLQADKDILRFLVAETVEENTRIGSVLPGSDAEESGEVNDGEGGREKTRTRRMEAGEEKKSGETDGEKNATIKKEA